MSVRSEPGEAIAYRRAEGPATLVFGDDPGRTARLAGLAGTLGGRVEASGPVAAAAPAIAARAGTAALLVDLVQDGGEPLDRLLDAIEAGAAAARLAAVLVVAPGLIDIVHARIADRNVAIAVDGDEAGIAGALAHLFRPRAARLTEDGDDAARRLAALGEETARIAQAIAALSATLAGRAAEPREAAVPPDPQTALAATRWLIRMRRLRERFFDAALFADPAWDMLLDLEAARLEGRRVAVSSLCIAAAVPATTALRWIAVMTERGLLARDRDPADGRRAFLSLTGASAAAMADYVAAVVRQPIPGGR